MVRIIKSLSQISYNYNVLFCDIWGCIHNGEKAYEKAIDSIFEFKKKGGFVMLLTNAPRPKSDVKKQLTYFGILEKYYDDITTSGDAAQHSMLSGDVGTQVFHLGPERDLSFFTDIPKSLKRKKNIIRVDLNSADGIVCTGLFDDRKETPDDYKTIIKYGVRNKLKLLCVNPDIFVDYGATRVWCAGGIASEFTKAGGISIYCGKPHKKIYKLAYSKLKKFNIKSPKILCIGDGIRTDILGGNNEKLDTLFVCGGLSGPELGIKSNNKSLNKNKVLELFQKNEIYPTASINYLC